MSSKRFLDSLPYINGMSQHDALAEGRLTEALSLQEAVVRKRPDDAVEHLFLVELLAFAGRLRESRDHLLAIRSTDPNWPAWRKQFHNLLRSEWCRSVMGGSPTVVLDPVPTHAKCRRQVLRSLRTCDTDAAIRWADRAEVASPGMRGFVNGREFAGLRDADDRFASILEAFAEGKYLWFPWEAIRKLTLHPVKHTRDRWVRETELRLANGKNLLVHIPLIYPDSANGDDELALGLGTDYVSPDGGVVQCLGAKLLLCGDEEVQLGDVRMIELRN